MIFTSTKVRGKVRYKTFGVRTYLFPRLRGLCVANATAQGSCSLVNSQVSPLLYNIEKKTTVDSDTTLKVGFGDPSTNAEMVKEVKETLKSLELGGRLCKITGPASLPVGATIIHHVAHLFGCISVFDPKLQKFVVCISPDPKWSVGDLID